jgi:TrkA-N domain
MTPPTYLIVGAGHFGNRAVEKLLEREPHSMIIVVDKNKSALRRLTHLPIETVLGDGTGYLASFLSQERKADYVLPAVPYHLAFEFIFCHFKSFGVKRVKVLPLPTLPNPVTGKKGDLYTSLADFLCREDCPEPALHCTHTGKRRQMPLHKILSELHGPFESKVIRSYQLRPGVGGFRPGELMEILMHLQNTRFAGQLYLISTASRCHGVTSALTFR